MIPHLTNRSAEDTPAPGETPSETWARLYRHSTAARERAEFNAALTMPEVYPPQGQNPDDFSAQVAYQSIGYRGVNNFVNVLATVLFRTSRSFFRLLPTDKGIQSFIDRNPGASPETLQAVLISKEQQATEAWVQRGDHDKLVQALSHIAVIGQACLWWDKPNDTFRVVPFQNYCLERTSGGEINTLIIAERLRVVDLEAKLQKALLARPNTDLGTFVDLYTRCRLVAKEKYEVDISVDDLPVDPRFTKTYKANKLPFAVPFWSRVPEASYAISMVDGLRGDLHKLNLLEEGQAKGCINLLDWRVLVNPGGQTDIEDFETSTAGQAIPGKPEDIAISVQGDATVVQLISQINADIERRLAAAFLMENATFRSGDRVTAEEIRRTVEAVERQYTGIYAAMSHHFQKPLARWILEMADLELDDTLDLAIITGLDALGRAEEVAALRDALLDLAQFAQLPEPLQGRMKWQAITLAVGAGHGVDLSKFLIPEEEYQQQIQQQQMQQLQMQVAAQQALQPPGETVP